MSKEPCKCCEGKKPVVKDVGNGYGYNRLEGEAQAWAKSNRFARSEYCIRVKMGKRFGGPDWIKNKCGDGRMGFSTRRRQRDEVQTEHGLDGQLKRSRSTLINKRSSRAVVGRRGRRVDGSKVGLVSSARIMEVMRDPIIVAQQRKAYRKSKRARNRNNRARRGYKRAMKLAA